MEKVRAAYRELDALEPGLVREILEGQEVPPKLLEHEDRIMHWFHVIPETYDQFLLTRKYANVLVEGLIKDDVDMETILSRYILNAFCIIKESLLIKDYLKFREEEEKWIWWIMCTARFLAESAARFEPSTSSEV